jgi:hypothetical protein
MKDKSYWDVAFPTLLRLLNDLCFDELPSSEMLLINRSITEWEVKSAVTKELGTTDRIVWLQRIFNGGLIPSSFDPLSNQQKEWNYYDSYDNPEKESKFRHLIDWMSSSIESSKRKTFHQASFKSYKENNEEWGKQIEEWAATAENYLLNSLQSIIDYHRDWEIDGCGVGIPGYELTEMLHHTSWAHEKINEFSGRDGLLRDIMSQLYPTNTDEKSASVDFTNTSCSILLQNGDEALSIVKGNSFSGITLSVIGQSGAGSK